LSLAPESGPAVAGQPFTYTLTFGNVGTSSPSGVELTMPVPEGTTFESTTGGGTESDGIVTWDVGTLGVGNSRRVRLTVLPNDELADGELLMAQAEIDPGTTTEVTVRSFVVTAVRDGVPLRIEYAVSQTALGQGNAVDVTLTAANTSPVDLTDVSARVQLPGFIFRFGSGGALTCGGFCDPHEKTTWEVGTLAPGESRTAFFRMFVSGSAPQGEVLRSFVTGISSSTGQVTAALNLQVDPMPTLRLSLSPDAGPVASGDSLIYTLNAGNAGTANTSDVVMRMPIPGGTSLVSASPEDGAQLQDGTVVWTIEDILSVGVAGQATVTVEVDGNLPAGHLLRAEAEIIPGNPNRVPVRSTATTAVRSSPPLQITYTTNRTYVTPGSDTENTVEYTLTATNAGSVDLTGVSAEILLPGFIFRFGSDGKLTCGSFCDANERTSWNIGTLAPGEAQTQSISFNPTVSNSAPEGDFLRSLLIGRAVGSSEVVLEKDVLIASTDTPLPVELAAFDATLNDEGVLLQWTTASETNNAGFEVQVRRGADGPFATQGFVDGHGTTTEAQTYRFRVDDLSPGPYAFRLKQIDVDGTAELSPVVAVTMAMKEAFLLSEAAPNPFRGEAWLTLQVREAQSVRAELYDVLGRRVATLHDGVLDAGREHRLSLDGRGLSSGLYLVRVAGERFAETRRVVVAR
jgi:uncharacterized repeat protein (TIGR01451 family)